MIKAYVERAFKAASTESLTAALTHFEIDTVELKPFSKKQYVRELFEECQQQATPLTTIVSIYTKLVQVSKQNTWTACKLEVTDADSSQPQPFQLPDKDLFSQNLRSELLKVLPNAQDVKVYPALDGALLWATVFFVQKRNGSRRKDAPRLLSAFHLVLSDVEQTVLFSGLPNAESVATAILEAFATATAAVENVRPFDLSGRDPVELLALIRNARAISGGKFEIPPLIAPAGGIRGGPAPTRDIDATEDSVFSQENGSECATVMKRSKLESRSYATRTKLVPPRGVQIPAEDRPVFEFDLKLKGKDVLGGLSDSAIAEEKVEAFSKFVLEHKRWHKKTAWKDVMKQVKRDERFKDLSDSKLREVFKKVREDLPEQMVLTVKERVTSLADTRDLSTRHLQNYVKLSAADAITYPDWEQRKRQAVKLLEDRKEAHRAEKLLGVRNLSDRQLKRLAKGMGSSDEHTADKARAAVAVQDYRNRWRL